MILPLKKIYRQMVLVLFDTVTILFSAAISLLLKLNFNLPLAVSPLQVKFVVAYAVLAIIFGHMFKAYSSILRHYSIYAAVNQVTAILLSLLFISLFFRVANIGGNALLSFSIIMALIHCFVAVSSRALYRITKREHDSNTSPVRKVVVIGAGDAASLLLKDMAGHRDGQLEAVAILDDNPLFKKRYLHGVQIFGGSNKIDSCIDEYKPDMVIIAIPSLKNKKMISSVSDVCIKRGVDLRCLPGLSDLADGKVSVNALRRVKIEDLLGRAPIDLDQSDITCELKGRSVMVTGGGGSIGSELCRQICHYSPKNLIVLEVSEYNLYAIELEIKNSFPELEIIPVLGSVADEGLVKFAINKNKPDVIFHAAAYKQVPLLESQRLTAINNNVKGTWVVSGQAVKHCVKKFVLVSTDKAVNPSNIMGCTKRISEIICQLANQKGRTKFSVVRFGNVLDSVGSVIPLFASQIKSGGPVTVTHPDITRYFMMIPEACQLILKAMQIDGSGKIFVLDMGDPIRISDLAEKMIQLSGKKVNEDIAIKYVGLRPGEKLYEELFHDSESLVKTEEEKIFYSESRSIDVDKIQQQLEDILSVVNLGDEEKALAYLEELVPESNLSSPRFDQETIRKYEGNSGKNL